MHMRGSELLWRHTRHAFTHALRKAVLHERLGSSAGQTQDDAELIQRERHEEMFFAELLTPRRQHFADQALRLDQIAGLAQGDGKIGLGAERERMIRLALRYPDR